MEEKELTDEELVKALEWCRTSINCKGCPKYGCEVVIDYSKCKKDLIKQSIDLIRRLQYGYSSASKASEEWKAKYEAERKENAEYERKLDDGDLVSIEWHDEQVGHANEEIERLTEENEYLDMVAKQVLADYQNAQVQVDELLNRRIEPKIFHCHADTVETCPKVQQAVKDTAKFQRNNKTAAKLVLCGGFRKCIKIIY